MHLSMRTRKGRVVARPIALDRPPGAMLDDLCQQVDPALLESSALHEQYGRYSILACRPLETLTLREGVLTDRAGRVLAEGSADVWGVLDEAMTPFCDPPRSADAGYVPGWIGYVGYEVGRHVERLPERAVRDTHLPDLRMAFYDAVLVYDAIERCWSLVEVEFDSPPEDAGLAAAVLREMAAAAASKPPGSPPPRADATDAAVRPAVAGEPNFSPEDYRRAVARAVEYIAAGDIFQVNLSQRLTVRDAPAPPDIYRALRRRNPAWYAAYLSFEAAGERCAVVSSSPELFLRVRGRDVLTRPIKGTRPRVGDREVDERAAADLLASAKDNAELAMIVDLLRNDLGRVCEYGSVRVVEPRRLEVHPTVYHLVATVTGRLHERVGLAGLLKATFPGGSITGAPKIRSMEIIDEIEPVARGVYTGCIGTVGVDGSCEWNIAIRTIVCDGSNAHVQVGGGIVADSQPDSEYRETMDKARAMLEAIAEAAGTT